MAEIQYPGAADTGRIRWYRTPLAREKLRELTERSDWKGFLQAGGFLGLLGLTAAGVLLGWGRLHPAIVVAILFLHGTFYAFLLNGFHELVHGTVFRTRALNRIFAYIYSFLSWYNPFGFHASHVRHHTSTLHTPDDGEVVLPIRLRLRAFLMSAFVDPVGLFNTVKDTVRLSLGIVKPGWELTIFPEEDRKARSRLFLFARITLAGHAAIVALSAVTGLWQIALVTTVARFWGGWLQYICNNTQHVGLQDNVPDFRLCCRSVRLNPFVRFLYFHMNYHAEHHMYAAVPCYNLGKLRRTIDHDMPPILPGLLSAWREIIGILKIQEKDPSYQHHYRLPGAAGA